MNSNTLHIIYNDFHSLPLAVLSFIKLKKKSRV
ncbi:hypothetical protein SAMN05443633_101665 [Chryseobacterium arachidis]|uniref:Uncharacterized protein n=1 Tax=Chryseobacterium arachidis TaxID=1416778 RepID=A0A1M4V3S8_9FLAO|nr:hypothetical protein SAMN05443633_101665 [Chryseobacterium arachidis]